MKIKGNKSYKYCKINRQQWRGWQQDPISTAHFLGELFISQFKWMVSLWLSWSQVIVHSPFCHAQLFSAFVLLAYLWITNLKPWACWKGTLPCPGKTHSTLTSQGTLEPAFLSSSRCAQLTWLQVFICKQLDNCILILQNNPATGAFAHHSAAVLPRGRLQPLLC